MMEEIEYKLNSKNPILISHAISKICESIAKAENYSASNEDLLKNTKVKLLLSKCQSEENIVSTTACLGLLSLVETGILSVSKVLSSLTASLSVTKNHRALITAINDLLILDLKIRVTAGSYTSPFKLQSPQHPFITVLCQEKEIWRDVLSQIQFDINHYQPMVSVHSEELLRPVFFYILANPKSNLSEACRQQTWNLLIKSDMKSLHLEVLQWFRCNDFATLNDTNYRILELAEVMILIGDEKLNSALMPIIASLAIQISKHGRDPRPNFDIIKKISSKTTSGCCLTLAILNSGIAESPVIYLCSFIQTCKLLSEKRTCCSIVADGLLSSLLQWLAYPGLLLSNNLKIAKDLFDEICSQESWSCDTKILLENETFQILIDFFPVLQFQTQLCKLDFQSQEEILSWLKNVFQAPRKLKEDLKYYLYGLLLQTKDSRVTKSVCDILLQITDLNLVASQMLPLILYALTNNCNPEQSTNLLFTIPELATTKENLPIIVHTFETFLNSGKALENLSVELYFRAWKREARLHSCLMKVLNDFRKKNLDLYSGTVCAKVMKEMCEIRPENAAELVPFLSDILNRRTNREGAPACALALKGISALCKSGIIDVSSTWRALAPKFEKEKRSVVLKSFCEFISDIPSYVLLEEDQFANVLENILSKLWQFVLYFQDAEVSNSAFKALKSFKYNYLSKKVIPPSFGPINLNLIESSETRASDGIPGTYWIHMLENLNPDLLSSAGDLLITYVEEETKFIPRIRGEAANYKALSTSSIIKAIGQCLMRFDSSYNSQQLTTITELLRIFAHKYSNPLPTVKYGYLEKCQFSERTKEYCLRITFHQSEASFSARKILEQHLTVLSNEGTDLKDLLFCYSNLGSICKGTSPYILEHFIEMSLNQIVQKALLGENNYIEGFRKAMTSMKKSLEDDTIPEKVEAIFISTLQDLFERVNEDSIFDDYLLAVLEIPKENLLKITSLDWNNADASKLRKAMNIRTELAIKQNGNEYWELVEEIFQRCVLIPETHENVLKSIQKIQNYRRSDKFNLCDILASMDRIQFHVLNSSLKKNTESEIEFLCDILLIAVCSLSGVDLILKNKELMIQSKELKFELFPLGFFNLLTNSESNESTSTIMMWLQCMKTKNVVPVLYRKAFHNTLISLRNEKHFENSWMTIVSSRPNFERGVSGKEINFKIIR